MLNPQPLHIQPDRATIYATLIAGFMFGVLIACAIGMTVEGLDRRDTLSRLCDRGYHVITPDMVRRC